MSEEQVSVMAKLNAERLMRGDNTVSNAEMRVIIAGLMLSVDKLASAFEHIKEALWSEEKMREMIADEVKAHCAGQRSLLKCEKQSHDAEASRGWAAWIGRTVRSIFLG